MLEDEEHIKGEITMVRTYESSQLPLRCYTKFTFTIIRRPVLGIDDQINTFVM